MILIISLSFEISALAQQDSSGFTNKAEAKNLTVKGIKEGKWIDYEIRHYGASNVPDTFSYALNIYKAGVLNGTSREFNYKSRKLSHETQYKDGKKNGIERKYYSDGPLYEEIAYSNDKRNGTDKEYYESGKLRVETIYNNNSVVSTRNFDEYGNEVK